MYRSRARANRGGGGGGERNKERKEVNVSPQSLAQTMANNPREVSGVGRPCSTYASAEGLLRLLLQLLLFDPKKLGFGRELDFLFSPSVDKKKKAVHVVIILIVFVIFKYLCFLSFILYAEIEFYRQKSCLCITARYLLIFSFFF